MGEEEVRTKGDSGSFYRMPGKGALLLLGVLSTGLYFCFKLRFEVEVVSSSSGAIMLS